MRCTARPFSILILYSKLHRSNFEAPDPTDFEAPLKIHEDSDIRSSRSNRFRSSVEDSVISIEDSDIQSSIEAPDRTDFEAPSKLTERDHFIILGCDGLWGYPVYFAFEDDDINVVLADVKKNDVTGQPATATTGGCLAFFAIGSKLTFNFLAQILGQVDVPVYAAGTGVKPAEIARQGLEEAKRKNMDVVIVDTAGRLQRELEAHLKFRS
ncbi:hypothetical protein HYC85_006326 [Camellia sinensis]|uniref:SRP54-type proteins GTP-binding domain-containing protein n=1 Tax=Camellia sinensis TaxID=4442 RepID=A0A7J7HKP6_CAMSI|nr:hypothetical protein HYC85_006326 [Camellia sinensis]